MDAFVSRTRGRRRPADDHDPDRSAGWPSSARTARKLASFSIAKYGAADSDNDWQWFPDAGNGVRTERQRRSRATTRTTPTCRRRRVPAGAGCSTSSSTWGAGGGRRRALLHPRQRAEPLARRPTATCTRSGATMDEIRDQMIDYGAVIKAVDPGRRDRRPGGVGLDGLLLSAATTSSTAADTAGACSPTATAHGGTDYLPWLLDQLRQHEQSTRRAAARRLHRPLLPAGRRVRRRHLRRRCSALRNRSTRSLWDPNYVDETLDRRQGAARSRG